MTIGEIIAVAVALLILAGAVVYIVKQKKKGRKCIGCPYGGGCQSCSCGRDTRSDTENQ